MAEYNLKKSIYGYNKDTLSWSAYSKWKGSQGTYRDTYYYETRKSFETAETIFGKKIGDYLENNNKEVEHIKKYFHPEHRIVVVVGGIKLLGYLDSFDKKHRRFLEYKTSHKNKKGVHSWNAVKVAKHKQLPWYSLLIQAKYGRVQNQCSLIYMETEKSMIRYKGRILEPMNQGLRLTGYIREYKRSIQQWERDALEKDIIKVAGEIRQDYERFKENN